MNAQPVSLAPVFERTPRQAQILKKLFPARKHPTVLVDEAGTVATDFAEETEHERDLIVAAPTGARPLPRELHRLRRPQVSRFLGQRGTIDALPDSAEHTPDADGEAEIVSMSDRPHGAVLARFDLTDAATRRTLADVAGYAAEIGDLQAQILRGVRITAGPAGVELVATDRYRAVTAHLPHEPVSRGPVATGPLPTTGRVLVPGDLLTAAGAARSGELVIREVVSELRADGLEVRALNILTAADGRGPDWGYPRIERLYPSSTTSITGPHTLAVLDDHARRALIHRLKAASGANIAVSFDGDVQVWDSTGRHGRVTMAATEVSTGELTYVFDVKRLLATLAIHSTGGLALIAPEGRDESIVRRAVEFEGDTGTRTLAMPLVALSSIRVGVPVSRKELRTWQA